MPQRVSAVGYFCMLGDDPASLVSEAGPMTVGSDRVDARRRHDGDMHHLLAKYLWDPHGEDACGTESAAAHEEAPYGRIVVSRGVMSH